MDTERVGDLQREHLSHQLSDMYQHVLRMATLVEEALQKALTAVSTQDVELGQRVTDDDRHIDALQFKLDMVCTQLIATEQPVATDLRDILVAMKIAGDLERIGDHARQLVRVMEQLSDNAFRATLPWFTTMTETGIQMLHDSITAYIDHDVTAARKVARRDDEIDALHKQVYAAILDIIREKPDRVEQGTALIFMSRFLERLGDHVTNMCEWIVYAKTGQHVELNKVGVR